mmetsp:Transcript_12003/g.20261  ORF Transcript_12003/g.20261 Transcript_12003/m.20261 type:complete len:92 (+) Transcript_12003:564-839(+)
MNDGVPCYMTSAFGAGCTAVLFGSPMDVLTTRHMNSPGVFKGPVDAFTFILKNEGVTAFYKGFTPNIMRLGGYNVILWLTLENIRKRFINS